MSAEEILRRKRILLDALKEIDCAQWAMERFDRLGDEGWRVVASDMVDRAVSKLRRFNEEAQ